MGTVTARIGPRIRINAISYNFSFVCAHSCIAMMFSGTQIKVIIVFVPFMIMLILALLSLSPRECGPTLGSSGRIKAYHRSVDPLRFQVNF